MARLPIEGSDNGTWGGILNDFLSVEHNSDGTLKQSGTIASKANDSAVVHNTGNETIADTKTFTSPPIVPTPTSNLHAATKAYTDSAVSNTTLYANVAEYGAVGDGVTDDTTAIQAAIDSGLPVWLPKPSSKYIITDTLDLRDNDGLAFVGENPQNTIIQQNTDNIPVLRAGGQRQCIRGLRLQFSSAQDSANTSSIGIEAWHLYESVIDRVYIYQTQTGIYMPQVDATGTNLNTFFSNTVSNVRITKFSSYGINLPSYNAGSTGCVFSNIYISNLEGSTKFSATAGIRLYSFDEVHMQQINIEHGKFARAFSFNQVRCCIGSSWHIEGVELTQDYGGFVDISDDSTFLTLNGLELSFNYLYNSNGINNMAAIFRFNSTAANAFLTSVTERNNTVDPGVTFYRFYGASATSGAIRIVGFNTSSTGASSFPTAQFSVLKQQNNNIFHLQLNGKNIKSASAAPTSDTWAVGDIVVNSAPASGLPTHWVCIEAGTPGTWTGVGGSDQITATRGAGFYGQPSDLEYRAWSVDPRYVSTSGYAPNAGTIYVAKLRTPDTWSSGASVSHEVYVMQGGSGATPLANCFVGLYRADNLTQIAVSTDRSSSWSTVGGKPLALTTSASKPAGVDVYAVILVGTQATTPVQFARVSAVSSVLSNGSRLSSPLFATADTGASALPATLASLTAHSVTVYHGLY